MQIKLVKIIVSSVYYRLILEIDLMNVIKKVILGRIDLLNVQMVLER